MTIVDNGITVDHAVGLHITGLHTHQLQLRTTRSKSILMNSNYSLLLDYVTVCNAMLQFSSAFCGFEAQWRFNIFGWQCKRHTQREDVRVCEKDVCTCMHIRVPVGSHMTEYDNIVYVCHIHLCSERA